MSHEKIAEIQDSYLDYVQATLETLSAKPKIVNTNSGRLSVPKILEIYFHISIASIFLENEWILEIESDQGDYTLLDDITFTYRGAPGKRTSSKGFNHFKMTTKDGEQSLELHLGIQVEGKSSVLHEIDVFICDYIDSKAKGVNFDDLVLVTEIKRYNLSAVDKSLAREFIGVLADSLLSGEADEGKQLAINNQGRTSAFFLSTDGSEDVRSFLESFGVRAFIGFNHSISDRERIEEFKLEVRQIACNLKVVK